MFSNTTSNKISLSKTPSDEYYYRKFNLKPLSIKLDKLPNHSSERKPTVQNNSSKVPILSLPPNRKISGYGGFDEEYYKKLFKVQDCRVTVPKITASKSSNKKKLAAIYDYQYAMDHEKRKKFECKDFSIDLSLLAGRPKMENDLTVVDRGRIKNEKLRNDASKMKSFVIMLSKVVIKGKAIKCDPWKKPTTRNLRSSKKYNVKDFSINLIKSEKLDNVVKNQIKKFSIVLPKMSLDKISVLKERNTKDSLKNFRIVLPRLAQVC